MLPYFWNTLLGVLTTTLSVLREATEDSAIKIVALTGSGDYFSSGNDLSNFLEAEVGKFVFQIKFMFYKKDKNFDDLSQFFFDSTKEKSSLKFSYSEKATKVWLIFHLLFDIA